MSTTTRPTPAHDEGGRLRLSASLLPTEAQELQQPVEDLLGQPSATKARGKRISRNKPATRGMR